MARLYFWIASNGAGTAAALSTAKVGEYDPLLGYRLTPNAQGYLRGPEFDTHFTINRAGLRMDRVVAEQRVPGKHRVLLMGDSFTFGHGVNNADRFGDRLESLLDDVEVVNMGVWGTGTDQQLLLYETQGMKYAPDLVMLCYLTENIQRNGSTARLQGNGTLAAKPKFILRDGELVLTNVPVPASVADEDAQRRAAEERSDRLSTGMPIPFKGILQQTASYQLLQSRLAPALHRLLDAHAQLLPEYDDSREEWQITRALFARFAEEAQKNGSDFLLVVIPWAPYVYQDDMDDAPHRMIRDFAEREGIDVLDLLPALKAAARESDRKLYYPIDGHWTPEGHAVAAREIGAYLKAHFPWAARTSLAGVGQRP